MKKLSFILATALFCGFAFTSCSDDDDVVSGGTASVTDTSTPSSEMIQFNAPFLENQTRTAITQDNLEDNSAYIFVRRTSSSSSTYSTEATLTDEDDLTTQATLYLNYASGTWTPSVQTPWYNQHGYKFYGTLPGTTASDFFMWNSSLNEPYYVSIPFSATADAGTDYLYAYTQKYWEAGYDPTVTLNFKHIYNNLNFHFTELSGDYEINVTTAQVYLPNASPNWRPSKGAYQSALSAIDYSSTMSSTSITSNYTRYSLPTGTVGSIADSDDFLILGLDNDTYSGMYIYFDITYNIVDSAGNTLKTCTLTKEPIYLDSTTLPNGTPDNPSKNVTINFTFDTSSSVSNMKWNAVYNDRDDSETLSESI